MTTLVRQARRPRAEALTLPLLAGARATRSAPTGLISRLVRSRSAEGDTLSPQLHFALLLQRLGPPGDSPDPVRMRRDHRRAALAAAGPYLPMKRVTDYALDGPSGRLFARHYTPPGDELDELGRRRPLVVYFHGGGFVLGDLDVVDHVCRLIAATAGVHVFSADYRLAPENPFPAGVDDAEFAFLWAREHANELGADPDRIAVAGDSAGGTLAALVTLRTVSRRREVPNAPVPDAQMLIYPSTHHHSDFPSRRRYDTGFFLEKVDMDWFFDCYVTRGGADAADPSVSPLLAPDLRGLPPTLIVTAAFDPLRDEGEAYGARLRDAGVPVVVRRQRGMLHGFLNMTGMSRDAHDAAVSVAGSFGALISGADRLGSASDGSGVPPRRAGEPDVLIHGDRPGSPAVAGSLTPQ
jgi:acetyl esterase/lipase